MHDLTRAGSAIAGHPAAKVPGAEALHPTSKASYFDILTVRIFRAVFLLHEFREVVAVGARRLTDKQKKKIVADYVQLQSYRAAAKLNDVSDATVKKVVKEDPESARLCAQKKRENSKDMLSYMESKQGEAHHSILSLSPDVLRFFHSGQFPSLIPQPLPASGQYPCCFHLKGHMPPDNPHFRLHHFPQRWNGQK